MALIKCPKCGKKISDTTTKCIHCGEKIKETNLDKFLQIIIKYKKMIVILLGVLIFLVIVINIIKPPKYYREAKNYASKEQYAFAIYSINKTKNYKDSADLLEKYKKLFYKEQMGKIITSDSGISIAVKNDGTVACSTDSYYKDICKTVSKWTNIKYVYSYGSNIYAVKNDGTVIANINVSKESYDNFLKEIEEWENIEYLSSASGYLVALHSDGTVSCSAPEKGKHGLVTKGTGVCDVSDWENIVYIEASRNTTYALNKDGYLFVAGENNDVEREYSNEKFIMISTGYDGFLGLKKNGTVVYNGEEAYNTKNWEDIVMISMGFDNIYGLKNDGSIVYDGEYHFDSSSYKNIVYIDAYGEHQLSTIDNKGNADLQIFWDSMDGEEYYKSYSNVKNIYTAESTIFAIKNDNTIACYNSQDEGCDVSNWKDLKVFK